LHEALVKALLTSPQTAKENAAVNEIKRLHKIIARLEEQLAEYQQDYED
jgi:hypothetical protein